MKYVLPSMEVPADYVCEKCGATGVKLWRKSATFSVNLACGRCVADWQAADTPPEYRVRFEDLAPDGSWPSEIHGRMLQTWSYVPAVPTEDGEGYYWLTAIPHDGLLWWQALPNEQPKEQP